MEAYNAEAAFNRAKQDQNSIATREYDKVSLTTYLLVMKSLQTILMGV